MTFFDTGFAFAPGGNWGTPPAARMIVLAIGDSLSTGQGSLDADRTASDPEVTGSVQWVLENSRPNYQDTDTDCSPLWPADDGTGRILDSERLLIDYYAQTGEVTGIVPGGVQGSSLAGGWLYTTPGANLVTALTELDSAMTEFGTLDEVPFVGAVTIALSSNDADSESDITTRFLGLIDYLRDNSAHIDANTPIIIGGPCTGGSTSATNKRNYISALAMERSNVYAMHPLFPTAAGDNLHPTTAEKRQWGAAKADLLDAIHHGSGKAIPTFTTGTTFTITEGDTLSGVLSHTGIEGSGYLDGTPYGKIEIASGGDGSSFAVGGTFLAPRLVEATPGTLGVGTYTVNLRIKGCAGSYGATVAHTVEIEEAIVTKSIAMGSAVTTVITGSFGTWTAAAFPIKTGANIIFVRGGTGGYKTSAAMTVGGNATTKIHDPGSGTIGCYAFVYNHAGADTTLDVVMTHSGSAMSNISLGSIVLTGYNMTPTQTEFTEDHPTDAGPWTTASLTCPAGGIVVGYMHRNATVSGAASGNTFLGAHGVPTNRSGAAYREDTGIMSITGSTGTANTLWAFAFDEA